MILAAALVLVGKGFLTDGSHPKHPGDFQKYEAKLRIELDAEVGIASIAIETGEGESKDIDRYFVRHGQTFQLSDEGKEIPARSLADLSVAAVAALHPALVESALLERPEAVQEQRDGRIAFSWNDVLWLVTREKRDGAVSRLTHRNFSGALGDGVEEIVFDRAPARVRVSLRGHETARFDFGPPEPVRAVELPKSDEERVIPASEIAFTELAPHVFAIDLASINSRVTVAEFADYLVVFEGAYNARNGDLLARAIRERFPGKPVRYFAFSHLHGQYIGSTRSYIALGATVLVPPTTVPLIEEIARAPHTLHPDALSKAPRSPRVEAVETSRRLEDATNALVLYNVPSEHTDESLVVWLPGPRILLTGDLLFYRPGKPLTGRSKRVCQTVAELGLDVDRYVATWPLDRYGTKNVVSGEEMKAACAVEP